MKPLVAITTITCNKSGLAKHCLESIITFTDVPFTLTIVDNGSTDELKTLYDNFEMVKKEFMAANDQCCDIQLIRFPTNRYICKATNAGFENRAGQFFCLIPSDTIMTEKYMSRLLANMAKYKLDGISPRWFEPKHVGQNPDIFDSLQWVVDMETTIKNGQHALMKPREELEPEWIVGIFWMVKREVWEKVGGWDEKFLLTVMDNDFVWRVVIHGFKVGIVNDVWIFHAGPITRMDDKVNPNYHAIGDQDWKVTFKEKWGTDPDDFFFLEKLKKEGVVRKKRLDEEPSQGIPKEIKDRRIAI